MKSTIAVIGAFHFVYGIGLLLIRHTNPGVRRSGDPIRSTYVVVFLSHVLSNTDDERISKNSAYLLKYSF